jgi:NADH-quinone oxidoreductase subunit C
VSRLERIVAAVGERHPGALLAVKDGGQIPALAVRTEEVVPLLGLLRNDFEFESLMCETASDRKDSIVIVYHLFSTPHREKLSVKTDLPVEKLVIETAERIWKAATWYEREIHDLFGVVFRGHSDLFRILLPPDWVGHPLRKDYEPAPEYHGMKIEW